MSFSPAGPYSVPRDAAVGSQVASALTTATATGVNCALIETAAVNGTEVSAGSGVYQTSVSGIGVSFYVVNGASQTLITSTGGGYTSGTISAPGNGSLPGIQANLVVTGTGRLRLLAHQPAECDRHLHADGQLRLEYRHRQHASRPARATAPSYRSPAP